MATFSVVGLTTYAQDNGQEQQRTEVQAEQSQDNFSEISVDKLPQPVSDAIKRDYPTATVSKAYKNNDEQYKVDVTLDNGTSGSLFFAEDGSAIDM